MIKAIIFDFDGVIIESAQIKTSAFRKLFEKEFPDEIEQIVNHHLQNMGISRFVKFKYIYENILQLPLPKELEESLGRKFSGIVFKEALNAPFVPGAIEFLEQNSSRYAFFIASGTPEEELLEILRKRKIEHYFKKIYGSPESKPGIISKILQDNVLNLNDIVFVGDATSDLVAAQESGVTFIARLNLENSDLMNEQRWKMKDLKSLDVVLNNIEQGR